MDFNQKIFKAISPNGPSKMNTTKWGFLLAVMIFIDVGEIILEYLTDIFFGIGHIVVMVAEMIIAPSFFFFLWWQNVRMTLPRVLSIFAVFVGEEAGGDDLASLWSGDVAFLWWAESKDRLLDQMGIAGNMALQMANQDNENKLENTTRDNARVRENEVAATAQDQSQTQSQIQKNHEVPQQANENNIVDLRKYSNQNKGHAGQDGEELKEAA